MSSIGGASHIEKLDEINRLRAVRDDLLQALRILAENNLSEVNCASVELAGKRVRNIARAAIEKATKQEGSR